MKSLQSPLQKFSVFMAAISFICAISCLGYLIFWVEEINKNDPISTSLMASIFFFVVVGVILIIMGKSDLPSFKFDSNNDPKNQ